MNDFPAIDHEADGQQCQVCGGRIEQRDGHLVWDGDEPIAYEHLDCEDELINLTTRP